MGTAPRSVAPEMLDHLAPDDPRARRSRGDLRRIHRMMGSVRILKNAITRLGLTVPPRRILELGAGDGSLMLRVAPLLPPVTAGVELILLDRHDLLDVTTLDAYAKMGWTARVLQTDVLAWAQARMVPRYDLCVASLFLHHFRGEELAVLLPAIAARVTAFVAYEPSRRGLAPIASRLVGLIGANAVTREDAVTSVTAGFCGHELSHMWPNTDNEWVVLEYAAAPFAHCFAAVRAAVPKSVGNRDY